jgi:hypothetical protein
MNKKEAFQSIKDKFKSRKRMKFNKKKKVVLAESKKEARKEIEVNKDSFNAKKDVREQIWDFLDIK